MPVYNGTRDEFVELMTPFLEGEVPDKEISSVCDRLLKEFGKETEVRPAGIKLKQFFFLLLCYNVSLLIHQSPPETFWAKICLVLSLGRFRPDTCFTCCVFDFLTSVIRRQRCSSRMKILQFLASRSIL
jgi:hypothetical protein